MAKMIKWVQGFDHLPSYTEIDSKSFNDMIKRLNLLEFYRFSNESKSKIGTAHVNGIDYKGINFGLDASGSDGTDFGFRSNDWKLNDTTRFYHGVRISMSDSVSSSVIANISSGDYPYPIGNDFKTQGGAQSYYIELVADKVSGLKLYVNGVLHTSVINDSFQTPSLNLSSMTDGRYKGNSGAVAGVGFVYSDFYYAEQPIEDPIEVYGSVTIKSCPVKSFSGVAEYYNSVGEDIVGALNYYYDETYRVNGSYLMTPGGDGVITYDIPTDTSGAICVAVSTLTEPGSTASYLHQNITAPGATGNDAIIHSGAAGCFTNNMQFAAGITSYSGFKNTIRSNEIEE